MRNNMRLGLTPWMNVNGSFISGPAMGTFSTSTGGTSVVQDSATGQITTIGSATWASGTEVTTTTANSNATASTSGIISGNGNSGYFTASSESNGSLTENDTSSFLATSAGFSAFGNSNAQATVNSIAGYLQQGTATTTLSAQGSTLQNTNHYNLSQWGWSTITTGETASSTITSTGYAVSTAVGQTAQTGSGFQVTNNGTTIVTTPDIGGSTAVSIVTYSSGQSSNSTGNSLVGVNSSLSNQSPGSESGQTFSTSGIFSIVQIGTTSGYYTGRTQYAVVAIPSSGTPAGATSATFGTDNSSQNGTGTFTSELNGNSSGSAASGTYLTTQNSTATSADTNTGSTITTGPGGGTITGYSITSSAFNSTYAQGAGSFTPAGVSGGVSVTQQGHGGTTQTSTEVYALNGNAPVSLPGGTYLVATTNQGTATSNGSSSGNYLYQNIGSFTPSASTGGFSYAQTGTQQYTNTNNPATRRRRRDLFIPTMARTPTRAAPVRPPLPPATY